jgi:hypothetical protein
MNGSESDFRAIFLFQAGASVRAAASDMAAPPSSGGLCGGAVNAK